MGERRSSWIISCNHSVRLVPSGQRTTSDSGALLLRETLDRSGVIDALEDNLVDPRNPLQQKISPINAYWYHNRSCIRRSLWITTKIICLLITLACLAARQHKTSVEIERHPSRKEWVGRPGLQPLC